MGSFIQLLSDVHMLLEFTRRDSQEEAVKQFFASIVMVKRGKSLKPYSAFVTAIKVWRFRTVLPAESFHSSSYFRRMASVGAGPNFKPLI